MPIFECEECHCVENTALSTYWTRNEETLWPDEFLGRKLCSECGPPNYRSGEPNKEHGWHGEFDKVLVSDTDYETGPDGFLQPPGGWK